ncbi:hypothetical protein PILCRDRAFT_185466 [Piloderma croceum F 1598]|uniref:Uncharacterized protein n=1 Tax=Piloderma croceum (strain F 1598) TaxID=765440 RepID=A0A0C3BVC1_PILCF|nr:hypothetical protein PILCRDRAFT_185466 [Piloderma croceum F 1598]
MATSSPRAVLPPKTIEMPTSPRQHYVSAASPEATSPSRVPRISLNPRPVLKDVKNILPSTSQVPSLSRRQPTRWVSKQPETQLRPSSMLRHSSSPTSTSLFSHPLITRRAPPTSPLAIPKREDASKPSTATIYGHVRSRHKMVPMVSPHARIVSETPPFISSPVKNPQPLTARSLPASSSLVDSMSFDLLKDPIFDGYYGPSASLDSLATVRCLSDDRRQVYEKSCPTRYRSVHPSRTSSRHDGISKSTPQANYIRSPICPIRAGPLLPPAPERPSKQSRHCPALTFPEAWRLPTESPPLSAGTIQVKLPSTNMLMKDDAVGFPVDMLDMLNTLETLATKVKTLEMPERVPKAKGNGCVRENDTRKINIEHRDMPTDNGLPVDKVPLMFNRLEKGKWRCIKPDLQGCTDKAFSISASGSNRPHLKLPNSQGWNMHGYIYNPYVRSELRIRLLELTEHCFTERT